MIKRSRSAGWMAAGLLWSMAMSGLAFAQTRPSAPSQRPPQAAGQPGAPPLAGRPRLLDACGVDIRRYCGSVAPGQGRLTRCLRRRNNQLQRSCRLFLRRPLTQETQPRTR